MFMTYGKIFIYNLIVRSTVAPAGRVAKNLGHIFKIILSILANVSPVYASVSEDFKHQPTLSRGSNLWALARSRHQLGHVRYHRCTLHAVDMTATMQQTMLPPL